MSESNAQVKKKPQDQQNSSQERQQSVYNTLDNAWTFSKKITTVDIAVYIILMSGLIIAMFFDNDLSNYCINAMSIVTTAYVSLRLGYTIKATIENVNKISESAKSLRIFASEEAKITSESDSEELG